MLEKANVVMLPTEKANYESHRSRLHQHPDGRLEITSNVVGNGYFGTSYPQHLYFTNNEEIKKGWFIDYGVLDQSGYPTLAKVKPSTDLTFINHSDKKPYIHKVIATTNPDLWSITPNECPQCKEGFTGSEYCMICSTHKTHFTTKGVPKIGLDFVEAFVRKQGKIKEVMLEYEADVQYQGQHFSGFKDKLKLRSNGTVIIHPVKVNPFDQLLAYAEQMKKEHDYIVHQYCKTEEYRGIGIGMDRIIGLIKRQMVSFQISNEPEPGDTGNSHNPEIDQ